MSAEETAIVVRRYYEVLTSVDHDASDYGVVAMDAIFHEPARLIQGRDAFRLAVAAYHTAFADLRCTLHDIVAAGDKAAVRWTIAGTHRGAFGLYPPSGKRVTLTGMAIHRVANGQMVEGWGCFDTLGTARQLGATVTLPEPTTL